MFVRLSPNLPGVLKARLATLRRVFEMARQADAATVADHHFEAAKQAYSQGHLATGDLHMRLYRESRAQAEI